VWEAIKSLIDDCDYYVVIVAGKYGSENDEGVSYTRKEYEYAVEKGKPVIAFLHRDPDALDRRDTETDPKTQEKLEQFKALCRTRLCSEWETPADLAAKVTTSLVKLMKRHSAVGWIRGSHLPDESAAQKMNALHDEVNHLKVENEDLKSQNEVYRSRETSITPAVERLEGNCQIAYWLLSPPAERAFVNYWNTTWEEVFSVLAPSLMTAATQQDVAATIRTSIQERWFPEGADQKVTEIPRDCLEDLLIQFHKMKLIRPADNRLPGHWSLTDLGFQHLYRVRAH
jgi:hypothetical protein